jgi:hypothetical protein
VVRSSQDTASIRGDWACCVGAPERNKGVGANAKAGDPESSALHGPCRQIMRRSRSLILVPPLAGSPSSPPISLCWQLRPGSVMSSHPPRLVLVAKRASQKGRQEIV